MQDMSKKIFEDISEQFRIMSTQAVMRSQLIATKVKINPTDLESIEILYRLGRTTAGILATHTGLTTGAVTGVIDRLVRAGYAKREYDPRDRRKVFVALNTKNIEEKIFPHYASLAIYMEKFLKKHSKQELNFILDFLKETNQISQENLNSLKE
jgi:DNA-binding MarR family transcriptional regulator